MLDWNPNKRELRTTLAVVVLCVLVAQSPLAAESGRVLNLQDAKFWTFFNGAWTEGADGLLQVPKTVLHQDGPAMQGHHYAFFKPVAYRDLHAQFEIRLMAHSDAGLIFRAASAGQFYILHFPNCGQASRAQHFWAALSRMDEDGYLRIVKLGLVNRVPSNLGIWLGVDAVIRENRVLVRIGDEGVFEATDAKYAGPGRVGLYIFGEANIRNVRIDGAETPGIAWDENKQPRRTWFYPTGESANAEWQRPGQVVRTPKGDLLLNYTISTKGKVTPLELRSTDNGRTWSQPQPISGFTPGEWEGGGIIHVFPDRKLRMLRQDGSGYALAETADDGRSWSDPTPVRVGPNPPGIKKVSLGPQAFLNLRDGSVVMFGYGGHDSTLVGANIWQWGAVHCQGFACRSTDNGLTWSDWVNIDNPGLTKVTTGEQIGGNLDLTEICGAQTGAARILAFVRPIYSPWMWEASSADGGRNWGPVRRGPFPGYAAPNMLRTNSGAILVAHRMPGLTINTSLDDGRTFDQGTMIDSGLWAMGSMIEVQSNLVLYIYWDSFESRMRGQLIRVTPTGIAPLPR
jgi:hypothetical protein